MTKEDAKRAIGLIVDSIGEESVALGESGVPSENAQTDNARSEVPMMRCGDLRIPENLNALPSLGFGKSGFSAPKSIDMRDYVTRIIDQGSMPTCACCSSSVLTETLLWRRSDVVPPPFDHEKAYRWCKQHDGVDGEGTDLVTALSYFIEGGYFDRNKCSVQVIRNGGNARELVKYCIHKFGIVQLGFNATREWLLCNPNKTSITGKKAEHRIPIGGHSVISLGYNRDGLFITNSWGEKWSSGGEVLLTWDEFDREFLYGAMISNCLDGLSVRT